MTKVYYKSSRKNFKVVLKSFSIILIIGGFAVSFYTFFPLFSWQIFFASASTQKINAPIPKLSTLVSTAGRTLSVDYTNAYNWFPNYNPKKDKNQEVESYTMSIPSIDIKDAVVSTKDINLTQHMVNFTGTSIPPQNGNSVVFGHSTLPQLYDPKNYKTVLANAYKIKMGDEILVTFDKVSYKYKVISILVVEPTDTSVLEQDTRNSFVTLITCTPPGTVWKRLVIKSQLVKI